MNSNTNTAKAEVDQKPAQIGVTLAPVIAAPKPVLAKEVFDLYCAAVTKGEATKKADGTPILPGRLSAYEITPAQRTQLREARRDYRKATMANKAGILTILRAKTTHTVAHRTTKRGGAVRYVKEKAFTSAAHFKAYVESVPVATLKPAK